MEESYKSYLPSANFQSVWTWVLYQEFRMPVHYPIWLLMCGSSFLLFKRGLPPFLLCALPNTILGFLCTASKRAVSQNLEVLCDEVIKVQPGINISKWDMVAAHVNEHLYRSGAWHNPYCVFNGKFCNSLFRLLVLDPFYQGTHDEQNTLLMEAVAVYEQNFNSWWQVCRTKAHTCRYSGEQKLPRDIYRAKIAWLWRNAYQCNYLRIQLATVTLVLLPWVPSTWKPFTSVFLCDPPLAVRHMIACPIIYMMNSLFYYRQRFSDLSDSHLSMLLAIIVEVKPKPDTSGWGDVAKHFNTYLQDKKVWPTPEFFYDGNDCLWVFNKVLSSNSSDSFFSDIFHGSKSELTPYITEALASTKNEEEHGGDPRTNG